MYEMGLKGFIEVTDAKTGYAIVINIKHIVSIIKNKTEGNDWTNIYVQIDSNRSVPYVVEESIKTITARISLNQEKDEK